LIGDAIRGEIHCEMQRLAKGEATLITRDYKNPISRKTHQRPEMKSKKKLEGATRGVLMMLRCNGQVEGGRMVIWPRGRQHTSPSLTSNPH